MNIGLAFDAGFCVRATQALARFLWRGMVMDLVSLSLGWAFRKGPAYLRYCGYCAALVVMFACVPATYLVASQWGGTPLANSLTPAPGPP